MPNLTGLPTKIVTLWELKRSTATDLRALREVLLVVAGKGEEPVAVVLPYAFFAKFEETIRAAAGVGELLARAMGGKVQ